MLAGGLVSTALQPAASQESPFASFHTWTDLTTIYEFSDRFRYDGDYGVQGLLTDSYWTQVWVRPSVRFRVRPDLSLHGGLGMIYNFIDDLHDLPELRPVVGLQLQWPRLGDFTFRHFIRAELRTLYLKSRNEWDASVRGRYQLPLTSPDIRIGTAVDYFVISSVEWFENFDSGDDFFGDTFRYNVGVGKGDVLGWRIILNYMFHRVRVPDSEQRRALELDDHVVRLRFIWSLR